ncbi:PREDICTED: T-cell acute lymphocytic leukemia protein 2-like [Charadrius vociferus]|uniref:T-cell acute lymphocytic leukemia protein 2-like n=1 Tax=Charadrius vociferus TaxID=50402 RepID=UPI0005219863|nr:PREDICTED: T-cell acute lymphocytic leukemia protein 2-like [Charadrius vociferus]
MPLALGKRGVVSEVFREQAVAARGSILGLFQQAPHLQSMEELTLIENCGVSSPGMSSNIVECWSETSSP